MYAFDIERPTTVAEAVNALKTDEAQPLGGGQTLIPNREVIDTSVGAGHAVKLNRHTASESSGYRGRIAGAAEKDAVITVARGIVEVAIERVVCNQAAERWQKGNSKKREGEK